MRCIWQKSNSILLVVDNEVLDDLYNLLEASIEEEPPISIKEGGIFKPGYMEQIDKLIEKVIDETFPGLPSSPYVMTGATDAQFYQPVCKNCIRFAPVIYGPEQMKGMHGLNENIEYNCLPGAVRFYKNLIRAEK